MIDFSNVQKALEGRTWAELQEGAHLGADTIAKIFKSEPVSLSSIQKLADLLGEELVVRVLPEKAKGKR